MRKTLIVALLVYSTTQAVAQGNPIRVIDGDTFAVGKEVIRIKGYDAPEIFSPRCAEEKKHGLAAKAYLSVLLSKSPVILTRDFRDDRYGRTLARVWAGGKDIAQEMIRAKYGVSYYTSPADRKKPQWCAILR